MQAAPQTFAVVSSPHLSFSNMSALLFSAAVSYIIQGDTGYVNLQIRRITAPVHSRIADKGSPLPGESFQAGAFFGAPRRSKAGLGWQPRRLDRCFPVAENFCLFFRFSP